MSATDIPNPGPLFEAVRIGTLQLRNRIVMAPMTRRRSPEGVPGDDVADYYERRAAGGAGLLITEGAWIDHPSAGMYESVPVLHGNEALAGWRRVIDRVHQAGSSIIAQLWHVGAERVPGSPPHPGGSVLSPSGMTLDGLHRGRAMSQRDIKEVTASYARAAVAAQDLGFDGVEVHGAHGYLIDQFLWHETNQRSDGYGGSATSRAQFGAEVVSACREATGSEYPIFLRISNWKIRHYDASIAADPKELADLLAPFVEAGVDLFHCSTRRYWEPAFKGSDMGLAGWVRHLTGRPTMTVGSVGLDADVTTTLAEGGHARATSIKPLLERLERSEFDLVALGRALIADPLWPSKVRAGRTDDVIGFEHGQLDHLV